MTKQEILKMIEQTITEALKSQGKDVICTVIEDTVQVGFKTGDGTEYKFFEIKVVEQ